MILGILVLAFIMYLALGYGGEVEKEKPVATCPPHRWQYFKPFIDSPDEQLICSVCNKKPSDISGE